VKTPKYSKNFKFQKNSKFSKNFKHFSFHKISKFQYLNNNIEKHVIKIKDFLLCIPLGYCYLIQQINHFHQFFLQYMDEYI
jgi:hypothetical protein